LENWYLEVGISGCLRQYGKHGALMLSSALNSKRSIKVNIQVMRIYTRIRHMLLTHKDILLKLVKMEQKLSGHDEKKLLIFEYIKQFEETKQQQPEQKKTDRE
jgi:hypothetical protein